MKVHDIFNMKSEQFFCALMSDIFFCNIALIYLFLQYKDAQKENASHIWQIKYCLWDWAKVELNEQRTGTKNNVYHFSSRQDVSLHQSPLLFIPLLAENRSELIKDLKYVWRKHITTVLFQLSNVKKKYHQNWLWSTIQELSLFMFCLI